MLNMKHKAQKKKRVFVAMSGGVDSSLSAVLLAEATPNNFEKLFGRPTPEGFRGYDVTGVFIKTWHPSFLECTWRDERRDAMRVAAHLGIPFKTLDLEEEYKRDVADYMIEEYRRGRTPNPDVMCNKTIKFGAFLDWAKREGADKIATGHYARLRRAKSKVESQKFKVELLAGKDKNKDQSYFLWTLTQDVLNHTLFPIGELTKGKVREMASERGLSTADKKDSQGVCFLGEVDMREFLSRYIDPQEGDILNEEGEIVGTHSGATFFTIGQRRGFDVETKSPYDGPHYVVEKDVSANTITVASTPAGLNKHAYKKVAIKNTNWIADAPEEGREYVARIRYRQPLQHCHVEEIGMSRQGRGSLEAANDKAKIIFDIAQNAVTPGQSLVLYDPSPADGQVPNPADGRVPNPADGRGGEKCLGGGVIM